MIGTVNYRLGGPPARRKLTTVAGESPVAVEWPHVFRREQTTGPDRLAIAPREDPMRILCDLASVVGPEYSIVYVLVEPLGQAERGRYQSPVLDFVDVEAFVSEFREFLANDARHELWISSIDNAGLLVYDDHGLIYAYGPLDEFERNLLLRGLQPGSFEIPAPHTHHFHHQYAQPFDRLMARWEWRRTDAP